MDVTGETDILNGMPASTLKELLQVGGSLATIRDHPSGDKIVTMPVTFKTEVLSNPDKAPQVTRRAPRFFETKSFVEYVNAFKAEGQTRIFVNPESLKAEAVIDYDKKDAPDRGVHRATLQLALSPEWKTWMEAAAQTKTRGFTQEDFAEFLEEHGVNVVAPPAADLIELVTKMQITRQVNYKRTIHLQDGRQQFTYTNDNESGAIEFPQKLELGIPVFKGGQHYRVTVLLRYRLQDGGTLRFGMIVHRHDEILRDAIEGDVAAIQEQTQVPVHIGVVG
jgi:uncharacterized protein YfdQ (DUF2303 family)